MIALNNGLFFLDKGARRISSSQWDIVIIAMSPNMEAAKYAAVCSLDFNETAQATAASFAAWAEGDIFMMDDK
jgi:hypothetical protein